MWCIHKQGKSLVRMWKEEFSRIVPSRPVTAKFANCKEHAHQKQPREPRGRYFNDVNQRLSHLSSIIGRLHYKYFLSILKNECSAGENPQKISVHPTHRRQRQVERACRGSHARYQQATYDIESRCFSHCYRLASEMGALKQK